MTDPVPPRPRTADANGRLWGGRARDWAELQEPQFRAGYDAVLAAAGLGPGQRFCDVGCGSGLAARLAADRGADVSGLDAAASLLAIARERVPGGDFRLGDMEDLPFDAGRFDLVAGFNSFQYAADPAHALREACRVAKPGGRVAAMVWGLPEGMPAASLVTALRPLLPPAPPGAPGPFALSHEEALRGLAQQAGLTAVTVQDESCFWSYPDLAAGVRGLGASGVAMRAREQSGEAAVDRAHREALQPFVQPDGTVRVGCRLRWMMGTV